MTQDALEFFQHMLELMTRAERSAGDRLESGTTAGSTADAFAFQLEDRKQVSVTTRRSSISVLLVQSINEII